MMPAPAAEPYRRARSSPASASGSVASARLAQLQQQLARLGHLVRADGAVATALPLAEETLEQRVQEAASLQRRRRVFVVRLLFQLQHFGREELEGALQVAIDAADADARKHPRAGLAAEARVVEGRPSGAQRRPRLGGRHQRLDHRRLGDQCFVREHRQLVIGWLDLAFEPRVGQVVNERGGLDDRVGLE